MTTAVVLEDARALVERAKEHLREFVVRYQAFYRHGIGDHFERPDPEVGGKAWGIKVTRTIPRSCTVVLYDVVNTLRSALDHAVYEASVRLGHPDPTRTKFPFADTAAAVGRQIKETRDGRKGPSDGVAPELDDCLIAIAPHGEPGGDHVLWGLNKLRNVKNHRKIVRLGFHPNTFRLANGASTGPFRVVHEWDRAKDEFIYLRAADPETRLVGADVEIGCIPLFVGVPELVDKAAVATLADLSDQITGHIRSMEAAVLDGLRKREA